MFVELVLQLGGTEQSLPAIEHYGRSSVLGAGDLQMQHPAVPESDQISRGARPGLDVGVKWP